MSEHAPLTEAERRELAHACWGGIEEGPIAADGELAATIERILAARTSTATADTGLRERVEALADEWERGNLGYPERPEVFIRELREALRGDQ